MSVGSGNPGRGQRLRRERQRRQSGGTGKGGTASGGKIVRFRASGFHVSGIARGKPSVSFTLTRGAKAPKFKSFTITLPSGLTFVRRRLGAGIHIRPAHSLRLHNGRLTITLKRAVNSVTVRMGVPALAESTQLRRHPKRRLVLPGQLSASRYDCHGSSATYSPSLARSPPSRSKLSPPSASCSDQVRFARSSHGSRTRACAGASA